ncbi:hypothetical protein BDB00DRAFT_805612 [Zychaea mexicana]|uniref:uncharacterized protein n=1 Tax=Zychaea mexicana TaxID=64656 RepID=UPI0022FE5B29|nr:uncharacterized protein BDB00DRAFT_805612 [Zychaea mexicana]KAI9497234.1 hypothetical protein BDB00DRAFT_805612 [Zychaea mexicana]
MRHLSIELLELIAENCQSSKDISQLSRVNQQHHAAAIRSLFHTVAIKTPQQYAAFLGHRDLFRKRGWLKHVRCLDLSSYSARGSGWTEAKAKAIVEPHSLAQLLIDCVNLTQLYVGEEMMQAFVEPIVIRAIFNGHPRLEVLDFTGFCDRKFTDAMAHVFSGDGSNKKNKKDGDELLLAMDEDEDLLELESQLPENTVMPPRLNRISFYMCMALSQSSFFIPFFGQLAKNELTRLDLANTKITSELFNHLDPTSLTHLNLQGCHGISCCSAFLPFLSQAKDLIELNLNMSFNGIGGSNFCSECLAHLVSMDMPRLRTLNLGGHGNMDDHVLSNFCEANARRLEYFSLASTKQVTVDALLKLLGRMPQLKYLNLAHTWFALDLKYLVCVLQSTHTDKRHPGIYADLKVIEVSPGNSRYPQQIQEWKLVHHGRRSYYSRGQVDPRFYYSNKLLLLDQIPSSPMTKYWSYSN